MKQVLMLVLCANVLCTKAQNIVKNGDLQPVGGNMLQTLNQWNFNGCEPIIGGTYVDMAIGAPPYLFENPHFNGLSTTNIVTPIEGCMSQLICPIKGMSYTLTFKHQRRSFPNPTQNNEVPTPTAFRAIIRGYPTFTDYVFELVEDYNQTFLPGWINTSFTFTIPVTSTDNDFRVIFQQQTVVLAGQTGHGAILDDVVLTPNPNVTNTGPTVAATNSNTNWGLSNLPATGVTYNWSFPGATPSSSTAANPTNVQWNTTGLKTVTCTIGNGICNLVTISHDINITNTLPAEIVSFNATEKTGGIDLKWVTASEINTDYFGIYKSKDGLNFTEIGRVQSAGLQSGATYNFTDAQPGNGTVYYRLKQVDKNSSFKTTGIVKLRMGKLYLDVNVYPTVINNVLDYAVETPRAANMMIYVTDMSGRNIVSKSENMSIGTNKRMIDASTFAKGAYLLTVRDGSGFSKTIKFTKN